MIPSTRLMPSRISAAMSQKRPTVSRKAPTGGSSRLRMKPLTVATRPMMPTMPPSWPVTSRIVASVRSQSGSAS